MTAVIESHSDCPFQMGEDPIWMMSGIRAQKNENTVKRIPTPMQMAVYSFRFKYR